MSAATTNLTLNNNVVIGASQTWNVGGSSALTVSTPLAGAAGLVLTKSGAGRLVLGSTVNGTFAGNSVINGGVLQLNSANANNNSAIGTGVITNNGATIQFAAARIIGNALHFIGNCVVDCNNFGAPLDGAWSSDSSAFVLITNLSSGTFTIGGNGNGGGTMNGFVGTILFADNTAGTVRFNNGGGNNAVGNINAIFNLGNGAATLVSRNNTTINLGELHGGEGTRLSGQANGGGTTVWSIGGKGTSTTFAGSIIDSTTARTNAIAKVGAGTLVLTGTNNTYSAGTTVSVGTLQVGNGGTAGALGTGRIINNAAVVYNRSDAIIVSNNISGSGSLTLQGGGVVTFEGTNSSSGTLTVNAGAAEIGAGGSIQSPVSLAVGTSLIVTNNPLFALNQILSGFGTVDGGLTAVGGTLRPGGAGVGGTLTFLNSFTNSGPVTYEMELATAGASDLINVVGDLTVTATNSVIASKLGGGTLAFGTYPLINYSGNFNGTLDNFTVTVTGVTGKLTNSPGQIALIISPAERGATNLTWLGDGVANSWDVDTSTNWVNGVNQFKFLAGDSVRFDAVGAANPVVTITAPIVLPAAVVVDSAANYTLTGNGSIGGSTSLVKTNSGTFTIQTTNTYSGPTIVGGGVLEISAVANGNSPSPIGASSGNATNLVLHNSSTLLYSGANASMDRGLTLVGGGNIDVASANLTFNGSQIVGTGGLRKSGVGTLTLSVPNGFAGGTVISNGVLALGSNNANSDGTGGSALGATNEVITLRGGILQLFGYNGGTGNNYSTLYNPINVPTGEIGTLRMFARGPVNTGANSGLRSSLLGGGTLNLVVNYIRDNLDGDWSAFTGTINVTPKPSGSGDEMRINNAFGYANAAIYLNDGVTMNRVTTANSIVDIGELGGSSIAIVGPGNLSAINPTWRVGFKNTSQTFAGTIANDGLTSVIKVGTGTWTLSGFNIYTGPTTISNGVLEVTGSLASTNIAVVSGAFLDVSLLGNLSLSFGQVLGGNGTVRGGVDASSGGIVAPGFSIGTLTVTNGVTLGGGASMEVNRAGFSSDKLVSPSIVLAGTLTLRNVGDTLQVGDTFDLFDGALSGAFSTVDGGYYTWDTSNVGINGTVTVTGVLPLPSISSVAIVGTDLVLSAVNGVPNSPVTVVSSTDVSLPMANWTSVATTAFDGSGSLTVYIPVDVNTPQSFYRLLLP
jgi:fibronectin-binding autotransporter adhesin